MTIKEKDKNIKEVRYGVKRIYFSRSNWEKFYSALENSNEYEFCLYQVYRQEQITGFDTDEDCGGAEFIIIKSPHPFRVFLDSQDIRQLVIEDKDLERKPLRLRLTNAQRRKVRRVLEQGFTPGMVVIL